MDLSRLRDLAGRWRSEAEVFRRRGLEEQATAADSYADDLEKELREWELEALTLEEAAAESRWSYDTVQRKVAAGEIPNAGRRGAPRVRRCDLYGAPAATPAEGIQDEDGPDLAGELLESRGR